MCICEVCKVAVKTRSKSGSMPVLSAKRCLHGADRLAWRDPKCQCVWRAGRGGFVGYVQYGHGGFGGLGLAGWGIDMGIGI